jgi:hypothetical protein
VDLGPAAARQEQRHEQQHTGKQEQRCPADRSHRVTPLPPLGSGHGSLLVKLLPNEPLVPAATRRWIYARGTWIKNQILRMKTECSM